MSVIDIFDSELEVATSLASLTLGILGCLYAYGFVGERLFRGFHWRAEFRNVLRWLAPVLIALSIASILMEIRL